MMYTALESSRDFEPLVHSLNRKSGHCVSELKSRRAESMGQRYEEEKHKAESYVFLLFP